MRVSSGGWAMRFLQVASRLVLFWPLMTLVPGPALAESVIVETEQGPVAGVVAEHWSEFRGIPFAQAPVAANEVDTMLPSPVRSRR